MSETESFHLKIIEDKPTSILWLIYFHRQLEETFFLFNLYLDCTLDIFIQKLDYNCL